MRSVRTTFQILETIADDQPIGLSELARRLEVPKSTVQRSLATLADLGWIRPDGNSLTRWVLGERVRTLSDKVEDLGRLREAALPILGQLSGETLETIHLAVRDADSARLIERLDSKHPLRLVQPIGNRSPLHASSTGKSILAHLPEAEIDAYLGSDLARATAKTITDPDQLRAELKATRERGYAVSDQELTDGIVSVAASVRPYGTRSVAAISISGAANRIPAATCAAYGRMVASAADKVAEGLRG